MNDDRYARTSPVHHCMATHNPRWVSKQGMETALQFDEADGQRQLASGIVDMSFLLRCGLKGPQSHAWLIDRGFTIPEMNCWSPLPTGGLIARLGVSEFMIEDTEEGTLTRELMLDMASMTGGVYPVLRQDCALALTGSEANSLMRQTCNVNFKHLDLPRRELALTSMAGVSVLVIPEEVKGETQYRIWFDATYGSYMWKTLVEIAKEMGGGAVGWASFTK